jgi:predicted MPP superfamily phosphohydrolase
MRSEQPYLTIWLVGLKKADARDYRQLLEESGPLRAELVPVRPGVEEYADLAASPELGIVLIGQALWKKSDRTYTSVDLALFLRALRAELPIFLVGDGHASDDEGAFDAVIADADLRERPRAVAARLLRAAGRFEAARSTRQERLQGLLDRQIAGTLTPAESADLDALRADYERAAQLKVARAVESQELDLLEKKALVEQLELLAMKLERGLRAP